MTGIFSKCNICGQFFDSKKALRKHKDKNHRISNSKMMDVIVEELITQQPFLPSKGNIDKRMPD
jgi:hypothetical protein